LIGNPEKSSDFKDSTFTLDFLENSKTHMRLTEGIRKKVASLELNNWTIGLTWAKAHTDKYGNELTSKTGNQKSRNISYDKISKSPIVTVFEE